jgi:hypothetical protein
VIVLFFRDAREPDRPPPIEPPAWWLKLVYLIVMWPVLCMAMIHDLFIRRWLGP